MTNREKNLGSFQLECIACKTPVVFSLSDIDKPAHIVCCQSCNKKYQLGEEPLKRQLKQFAALCLQIQDSQEILGDAHVAVDVGEKCVQIPFKLLLTRLKSVLNLKVGPSTLCVSFRVETGLSNKSSP